MRGPHTDLGGTAQSPQPVGVLEQGGHDPGQLGTLRGGRHQDPARARHDEVEVGVLGGDDRGDAVRGGLEHVPTVP